MSKPANDRGGIDDPHAARREQFPHRYRGEDAEEKSQPDGGLVCLQSVQWRSWRLVVAVWAGPNPGLDWSILPGPDITQLNG